MSPPTVSGVDLLASGPDRPSRQLPRPVLSRVQAVLLGAVVAVGAAGVLAVPRVRAASAP
ncbi:MAG: hypothetical protein JWO60_2148, partial [Frankiales bacterium]|nr:hypothetical protein [Frankiales bacterium]